MFVAAICYKAGSAARLDETKRNSRMERYGEHRASIQTQRYLSEHQIIILAGLTRAGAQQRPFTGRFESATNICSARGACETSDDQQGRPQQHSDGNELKCLVSLPLTSLTHR